jgi:hypothetical protein
MDNTTYIDRPEEGCLFCEINVKHTNFEHITLLVIEADKQFNKLVIGYQKLCTDIKRRTL